MTFLLDALGVAAVVWSASRIIEAIRFSERRKG